MDAETRADEIRDRFELSAFASNAIEKQIEEAECAAWNAAIEAAALAARNLQYEALSDSDLLYNIACSDAEFEIRKLKK